jgi:NAD-dependent DNA ligase
VLSVGEWTSLPTALVEMLADETIAKVGVNISGDGARLARDFDVPVCGLLNLEKGLGPKMTMEKLCSKYCPSEFHISKDSVESKVRLGNWASWPLSTLQLKYASMDAVLSFAIFLFQQKGSWEGRQELLLPKVADCTLDICRPLPVAERKELQRAPSTGGKNSNFFLMHQNRSIVPPNMNNKEHPRGDKEALRGVVVVVSGVLDSMSRDEMSAYVVSHGGKVAKSITKKTTHLVNDHGAVGPSKLEKCKAQGVPVVGEDHILGLVRTSSTSSQAGAAADSVPAAGAE